MSRSKDDWINQRAYAIWEEEGRPHDRGGAHWQQAAAEYEQLERTRASADGNELIEMLRRTGRLMRAAENDARPEQAPVSKAAKRA
jgi:hypothetical protein